MFQFEHRIGEASMIVQDLETHRRKVVGPGAYPLYSPNGHLIYQSAMYVPDLWAAPFSPDTWEIQGEAFPVSQNSRGATVASDGTLVYVDGTGSQQQLVWLDRSGAKIGEIGQAQEWILHPKLSPDGNSLAVAATEELNRDVWVWDLTRNVKTRVTTNVEADDLPVWSPDGKFLAFSSYQVGDPWGAGIFRRRADGTGEVETVLSTPLPEGVRDWSRDGKYLLYRRRDPPKPGDDLWYLERNEDGRFSEPRPFLVTPFRERAGKFSPDGRYVANVSNETGRYEVYVHSFPKGDRKWPVTSQGGNQPRWRPDGKELLYVEGGTLFAVPVSTDPTFSLGSPTRLFEHPSLTALVNPQYDVSADGERFVLAEPAGEPLEPTIHVVENWFEEFRGREQD